MKIIEQSVEVVYPRTLAQGVQELKHIEAAGRNCWRSEGRITEDSYKTFVKGLLARGHGSPIEFGHIILKITTSRDVMAELTRHRVASFCVSGDTIVGYNGRNKGITIRDLYNKPKQYQDMTKLRSIDEVSKEIILNPVKKVFCNGIQQTYTVATSDGYVIRATSSHEFLTDNGWKQLRDIVVGEKIYTNGIEAYKQKEWLYARYHIDNMSQQEMATLCGVSHHTIRAWIRKFGLQKDMGSWCIGKDPVNKGKTKYDYAPMMVTSQKMHKLRTDPNSEYSGGKKKIPLELAYGYKNTNSSGYDNVFKNYKRSFICQKCGEHCDYTEVHHIDGDPKNFTPDNLIELCVTCHKHIHKGASVFAVKPSYVSSIEYYGEEEVYDIEMEAPYHNYVANGFVVHNCVESQRYVDEYAEGDIYFIAPLFYKEDPDDPLHAYDDKQFYASMVWRDTMENVEQSYKHLCELGMKNEDARKVLPNSTATTIFMDVNLRELLHIYDLRSAKAAYPEMRECMRLMKIEVDKVLPGFLPDDE